MTKQRQFCIGGIDESAGQDHYLIRFVDEKDLVKCQSGTFLVGSVDRNRGFDGARADAEELTYTVSWPNRRKEPWTIAGDDSERYLAVKPGKKITGLAGRGGLTRGGRPLVRGNPLSLSLSMIPRTLDGREKRPAFDRIRHNLGLPEGTPALWFVDPDKTIKLVSRKLCEHLSLRQHLVIISGAVIYEDRTLVVDTFQEFKDTIDELFNSGVLDLDRLFSKPRVPYEADSEYRILWMTHSGTCPNTVAFPLMLDYQNEDHVILQDIDFGDHFTIVRNGDELQ